MKDVCKVLFATIIVIIALSGSAFGDTWTLARPYGGNGTVDIFPGGFTLYGADHWYPPDDGSITTYTFIATRAEFLTFNWNYSTYDEDGPTEDPAGYLLNGLYTDLSSCQDPSNEYCGIWEGFLGVNLVPGDTFGFYVYSRDDAFGGAQITVRGGNLPEPAPACLIATALLGCAVFRRRLT